MGGKWFTTSLGWWEKASLSKMEDPTYKKSYVVGKQASHVGTIIGNLKLQHMEYMFMGGKI